MEPPIENRRLHDPIIVEDGLNGRSIRSLQSLFPLTELDFHKLQGSAPKTTAAAVMVASGVLGFVFGLGPKFMAWLRGGQFDVTASELYTILAGVVFSVLLYLIGCWMPNDRKATIKKIKKYFQDQLDASNSPGGTS